MNIIEIDIIKKAFEEVPPGFSLFYDNVKVTNIEGDCFINEEQHMEDFVDADITSFEVVKSFQNIRLPAAGDAYLEKSTGKTILIIRPRIIGEFMCLVEPKVPDESWAILTCTMSFILQGCEFQRTWAVIK